MSKEEKYERDLEADLEIDKFNLPDCCDKQANIYQYWSSVFATAQYNRDKQKGRVGIIRGQRELDIRKNPPEDHKKLNNDIVAALVASDKEVIAATRKLDQCNRELNTLAGVLRAFDMKKSDLENLVKLQLGGFYAAPKVDTKKPERASKTARTRLNKKKEV